VQKALVKSEKNGKKVKYFCGCMGAHEVPPPFGLAVATREIQWQLPRRDGGRGRQNAGGVPRGAHGWLKPTYCYCKRYVLCAP